MIEVEDEDVPQSAELKSEGVTVGKHRMLVDRGEAEGSRKNMQVELEDLEALSVATSFERPRSPMIVRIVRPLAELSGGGFVAEGN